MEEEDIESHPLSEEDISFEEEILSRARSEPILTNYSDEEEYLKSLVDDLNSNFLYI